MTIHVEQQSSTTSTTTSSTIQSNGKSSSSLSSINSNGQTMSIICTGPVIPSVIYHHHHHMYYVNNGHITNGCTMSSPTSSPATQPLIGNHFIDNNGLTPIQSRLTIPIGSIYQPTSWLIEPLNHHQHFESCSKINNNNNNGNNNNSNSNKLESSPKSPATSSTCSSSGGTSSYFASNSSGGSSRHSPFTVSLSSSSSSTSSTPSVSLSPDSTCEQTDDTTRNEMNKNENIKSVNESMIKVSSSSSSSLSNYSGPGFVQHQTLTAALKSTLTPSILANSSTPLLSGSTTTSGGTFVPSTFFGTMTGTMPNPATGGYITAAIPINPNPHHHHLQHNPSHHHHNPSSSSSSHHHHPHHHNPPTLSPLSSNQHQPISLRDYYARFGVHYTPVPWNQSYGMERVWMSEFRRIFSAFYNELWSIQPVERKPNGIKLHMFVDSAKVRFCCDRCGHSWTSMKGRIVFWFNLLPPNFNTGIVTIKLFGQKCETCKIEVYEQPMWYPEEVTKVLMNLFNRVGQIFYGFEKTKFEKQRRMGKPRTPHNKFLCQACLEGICLSRRRACAAAGQPIPSCPIEDGQLQQQQQQKDEEGINDEDKIEQQTTTKENEESELINDHKIQVKINDDDDDEGDYSEDSGIVDNEADRLVDVQPLNNSNKIVEKC